MPVTVHAGRPAGPLPAAFARWRPIPVSIAIDLGGVAFEIDPAIRPLLPPGTRPRLFGRAVTARCEPPDFGAVLYAADLVGPGEVLVIAAGGRADTAMIGEIVGGYIRRRGGVGLVCDGAIRDVANLAAMLDFPVFARHVTPRGPTGAERGAVNEPVTVGGRIVTPGDLVIGDDDGLVALSPEAVTGRIEAAEGKLAAEASWEESLAGGRSIRETFGLPDPA